MKGEPTKHLALLAIFLGTLAAVNCFSVDLQSLQGTEDARTRSKLLELLYRVNALLEDQEQTPNSLSEELPKSEDYNSRQEGLQLSKKNEMGVLPPWNEFCRMMRISNCFHSQH